MCFSLSTRAARTQPVHAELYIISFFLYQSNQLYCTNKPEDTQAMLTTLAELITSARAELRCLDAETAGKEQRGNGGTMISFANTRKP